MISALPALVFALYFKVVLVGLAALVVLRLPPKPRTTGIPLAAILAPFLLTPALLYPFVPSFSDYGEVAIPVLARNLLAGGPIYGGIDSWQGLTGSNYGPLVFQIQALALQIRSDFFGSKMFGVSALLAGLGCLWAAQHAPKITLRDRLSGCVFALALFSACLHFSYWNRPDSFLIALSALAALVWRALRPAAALCALAVIAALAANLKLFGFLYVAPLWLAAWFALPTGRISAIVFSGVAFCAVFAAPFLLADLSFEAYLANLSTAPNQGLEYAPYEAIALAGILLLVLHLTGAFSNSRKRLLSFSLAGATLVLLGLSGKPGGGSPYLLPLLPIVLAVGSWSRAELDQERRNSASANLRRISVFAALVVSPFVLLVAATYWVGIRSPERAERAVEMTKIITARPAAEMGHAGGPLMNDAENLRALKAFAGQVTRVDFVNYADLRLAGVPVSVIYPLFNSCRIPAWILPNGGVPFTGQMYDTELFDDEARRLFLDHYRMTERGRFYEVWTCRDAGSQSPG